MFPTTFFVPGFPGYRFVTGAARSYSKSTEVIQSPVNTFVQQSFNRQCALSSSLDSGLH